MLCGIFVGGKATRMHGQPKGLLLSPESGEPLVARLVRLALELELEPVLVGNAEAYRATLPGLPVIADCPADIGPLGGLSGLLAAARTSGVLALSCDLPILSRTLLERLVDTPWVDPGAHVLAPRADNGLWEPLAARYDAGRTLAPLQQAIAHGTRSFQRLFADLTVEELRIAQGERAQLTDWDTPEDVRDKR